MICPICTADPIDPDLDCPECQVAWTEIRQPGTRVRVTLPSDIAPWFNEDDYGASWDAVVVGVNGDSIDVTTPTGDVEPVDGEYVTLVGTSA